MRYSDLTERVAGERADAWVIHNAAAQAKARGEDVVVMSVGDPDFDTPAEIVAEAKRALDACDTHYTSLKGRERFRSAIINRFNAAAGTSFMIDNVANASGTQNALFCASAILLNPGDEVLVLEPMYVTYEAMIRATGATLVPIPCPVETGFRPDLDAMAAAVTERTRAIFYATPVNPTGTVLQRGDVEAIAEIAIANDLWVVTDEVYGALMFEGEHLSIAGLPGMAERTVTAASLSKSHAMPGWRIGWAIGPAEFIEHFSRLALCMVYGLPGFVQEASALALEREHEEVATMREAYRRRRDAMMGTLDGHAGLACRKPDAGMFLMLDITGTGLSSAEFCERLYAVERVSVLDGAVRVSFAMGEDELKEGCRRIARFVDSLARMEVA